MLFTMGAATSLNLSGWTFLDWDAGGTSNDRIIVTGDGDAETITGSSQRDDISGNGGNDTINGGLGNDVLNGGTGMDSFDFTTALNAATNVDTISGFVAADDTIRLDNAVFTGLAEGQLDAVAFHIGATAADDSDRIIYDSATGALFFDSDGNGAASQVRFATVTAGLALTVADFVVM